MKEAPKFHKSPLINSSVSAFFRALAVKEKISRFFLLVIPELEFHG